MGITKMIGHNKKKNQKKKNYDFRYTEAIIPFTEAFIIS